MIQPLETSKKFRRRKGLFCSTQVGAHSHPFRAVPGFSNLVI
jgi:hypothetical protein